VQIDPDSQSPSTCFFIVVQVGLLLDQMSLLPLLALVAYLLAGLQLLLVAWSMFALIHHRSIPGH
jgi:hypothetical protein